FLARLRALSRPLVTRGQPHNQWVDAAQPPKPDVFLEPRAHSSSVARRARVAIPRSHRPYRQRPIVLALLLQRHERASAWRALLWWQTALRRQCRLRDNAHGPSSILLAGRALDPGTPRPGWRHRAGRPRSGYSLAARRSHCTG